MAKVVELKRERAKLVEEARSILEAAETEKREVGAEEQERWDKLVDEADKLAKKIEREERMAVMERELGDGWDDLSDDLDAGRRDKDTRSEAADEAERIAQRAFALYATRGLREMPERELRALQVDQDSKGGYLASQTWVNELIKEVDDMVFVRTLGRTFAVPDGTSLGAPKLENDPADADWTVELGTGNEDSTMSFGARELTPHPLAKRIKMSRTMLRKVPGAENLVRSRLAYKFGITMEKGYLTGNGSQQPLGMFTASGMGISTSRDVSTGNTTTAMTFDGLINAKYSVKSQYWPRAGWMFHRDGMKQLVKIKDGEGQYIWRASIAVGEPDMLLGQPVYVSEYVPNTFTTGLYVGIYGDFSWYWIADSLQFELQRLDELYSESNQVGLIGRWESDGMPVLEEAFARVKLA